MPYFLQLYSISASVCGQTLSVCTRVLLWTGCPAGMYKWSTGTDHCVRCHNGSSATSTASVQCQCDSGYYRAAHDKPNSPCTRRCPLQWLSCRLFTAQCTLVQSAVLRSHVVCLSVRLSVCNVGDL